MRRSMYVYGLCVGESAKSGADSKRDRLIKYRHAMKLKRRKEKWAAVDWDKIKKNLGL